MEQDWNGAGVGAYFCKTCGSLYILIARNRKYSLASLACPTLDDENNVCERTLHAMATSDVIKACTTAGNLAEIYEKKTKTEFNRKVTALMSDDPDDWFEDASQHKP